MLKRDGSLWIDLIQIKQIAVMTGDFWGILLAAGDSGSNRWVRYLSLLLPSNLHCLLTFSHALVVLLLLVIALVVVLVSVPVLAIVVVVAVVVVTAAATTAGAEHHHQQQ